MLVLHMQELVDEKGLFQVCRRIHADSGRASVALQLLAGFLPVINDIISMYIMRLASLTPVHQSATQVTVVHVHVSFRKASGQQSHHISIITSYFAGRQAR